MISLLVDGIFAGALLIAGLRMVSVHRTLEQLCAHDQQYQIALEKTAAALAAIRVLLSDANTRDYESSSTLVSLIAEARATISKMDARLLMADQERLNSAEQHGEPTKKDEREMHVTAPAVIGTSHAPFAFCRRVSRPMVEAIAGG